MTTRKTQYKKINPLDVVAYYANPAKRTDREAKDFQALLEYVKNGGVVPAISVVWDPVLGMFRQVGGHRRVLAHVMCGLSEIPAEITYPNEGEDAADVQQELWASEHQQRPIVGKDYFYVALATNGDIIMNKTVGRAWTLVEEHVPSRTDREWLKQYGTTGLMTTALAVTNFCNNILTGKKKALNSYEYSLLYRQAMRWLTAHGQQRDVRDYVGKASPNTIKAATLINHIRNNTKFPGIGPR